jgi:hypothetical protein
MKFTVTAAKDMTAALVGITSRAGGGQTIVE